MEPCPHCKYHHSNYQMQERDAAKIEGEFEYADKTYRLKIEEVVDE